MSFNDVLNNHNDCEVVIIPRFVKGRPKLVPGLYCQCHCKLIKWLRPEEFKELSAAGVEVLEPVKADKTSLIRQELSKPRYNPMVSKL